MSYKIGLACLKCSLAIAFMLLLQPLAAQYSFTELDEMLVQKEKKLGSPLVALVWKDGKIIYKKDQKDFTINEAVPVASCTKWLTAALVLTFVDEGKLSLDDNVAQYIPIFESYSKRYVTIRHCLSHTTGIEAEQGGAFRRKKFSSLEEEANVFASKRAIINNPGKEFFYSNVGPNTAGRVLEVISKRRMFSQLMKDRIFKPLGMKRASMGDDVESAVNPAGGMVISANDYMNFLSMLMNKGMFNGKRVLSEASVEEMFKIQTNGLLIKYAPKVASGFQYALGCWVQEADDKGNAIVLSSPGLFGTWPYIDRCRNCAAIFLTKKLLTEDRKEAYMDLKEIIDSKIASTCK
jgi:CubicO group peptidase (beta-lactamase class C family)